MENTERKRSFTSSLLTVFKSLGRLGFFVFLLGACNVTDLLPEQSQKQITDLCDKGDMYLKKGNFDSALLYLDSADQLLPFRTDPYLRTRLYASYALFWHEYKEYETAIAYHNKAYKVYRSIPDWKNAAMCMVAVGNEFLALNQYDKAKSAFDRALELGNADEGVEHDVCHGIGFVYAYQGNHVAAMPYLQESLTSPYTSVVKSEALLELGQFFFEQEKLDSAQYYLLELFHYPSHIRQRAVSHDLLYKIACLQKDSAAMRTYGSLYITNMDTLMGLENDLYGHKVIMNDVVHAHRHANMLQTIRSSYYVIILLVAVGILGICLWVYFYQKHKKRAKILLYQHAALNNSLEKLHEEQAEQSLASTRKTEMVEELLAELRQRPDFLIYIKWKNWKRCVEFINKILYLFFERLHVQYPDLSEQDQRLCLLVLFDFRAKEMAEWLYLSESSIGKTKYRVAQKLGCTSGELRNKLLDLII